MNLNLIEVVQKTLDSIDAKCEHGGWQRLAVVIIGALFVYALICSAELFKRRKK